jgi:hypothetical protein
MGTSKYGDVGPCMMLYNLNLYDACMGGVSRWRAANRCRMQIFGGWGACWIAREWYLLRWVVGYLCTSKPLYLCFACMGTWQMMINRAGTWILFVYFDSIACSCHPGERAPFPLFYAFISRKHRWNSEHNLGISFALTSAANQFASNLVGWLAKPGL